MTLGVGFDSTASPTLSSLFLLPVYGREHDLSTLVCLPLPYLPRHLWILLLEPATEFFLNSFFHKWILVTVFTPQQQHCKEYRGQHENVYCSCEDVGHDVGLVWLVFVIVVVLLVLSCFVLYVEDLRT